MCQAAARIARTFRWGLTTVLTVFALAGFGGEAVGQTIGESLSTLGEENGQLYVAPLSGGLAAALNSGSPWLFGYEVLPRASAACASASMCAGVGKSGSPRISETGLLPRAACSRTSAEMALTAVGRGWAIRLASFRFAISRFPFRGGHYTLDADIRRTGLYPVRTG